MQSTLAIGILGLGSISEVHQRNLSSLPKVRIAALWDFSLERSQEVARRYPGCAVFADYRELIERAPIDALIIAIPPYAHDDQEILAARRRLPFLVEKPIALTLAKARLVEREIVQSGVLHAVGYHNRYAPQVDRAKEQLAGSRAGMVLAHTFWKNGKGNLPTPHHIWLFQKERSGGQLHEHTSHLLDLARYLVGEVRSIYARGAVIANHDDLPGYATTDVDGVHLEFANGAIGLVGCGHFTPRAYWWGLNILTDRLIVELDQGGVRTLRDGETAEYRPTPPNNSHHYHEDVAFVEAVRRGDQRLLRSTYSDAMRSAAISLAANESEATGQVIDLESFLLA